MPDNDRIPNDLADAANVLLEMMDRYGIRSVNAEHDPNGFERFGVVNMHPRRDFGIHTVCIHQDASGGGRLTLYRPETDAEKRERLTRDLAEIGGAS